MPRNRQTLIELGWEAIRYARGYLYGNEKLGPSNVEDAKSGSLECVAGLPNRRKAYEHLPFHEQIFLVAEDARSNGCGNCGEHAALVFEYLVRQGVTPIEMANEGEDHAIVIIGGKELGDPRAIVVDAYKDQIYEQGDLVGVRSQRYE